MLLVIRPEVIAVLQVVRNERNGDMNMTLGELMRDAERLLTKNKSVLKTASLTARARVSHLVSSSAKMGNMIIIITSKCLKMSLDCLGWP